MTQFMKITAFTLVTLFLLGTSCKNEHQDRAESSTSDIEKKEQLSLVGTWELTSFYNYIDNEIADTIPLREGNKQMKIYTPTRVMWSKRIASEPVDWFGYGRYSHTDSTLTEVLDYGSITMNEIIKQRKEFVFNLILDKDRFTQIELDDEGNIIYAENYIRIE